MMDGRADVDFRWFHEVELPTRLGVGNGRLACDDVADVGSIALRLAETKIGYTYVPASDGIEIVAGVDGARTVVELDQEAWNGLAADSETAPGLLYSNRVQCTGGSALRFVRWEPALRAMYHGRPIFDPASFVLTDGQGRSLDPRQTFELDGDRADMARFLDAAGYLLVRQVFDGEETARLRAATDRLREAATPGDGGSWWARDASGAEVLSRVTRASVEPDLLTLYGDERLTRLAGLSRFELTSKAAGSPEGVKVLWKRPDIVEGLSDLPWHRDCGMGGHATMCPLLVVTVCVAGGGPDAGQLRMLPGSWHYSYPFVDADDPAAPQGVPLDVQPGDVTLHYGDTMHVSCPPRGAGPYRASVLLSFVPDADGEVLGGRGYNETLTGGSGGHVQHLRDRIA